MSFSTFETFFEIFIYVVISKGSLLAKGFFFFFKHSPLLLFCGYNIFSYLSEDINIFIKFSLCIISSKLLFFVSVF